MYTQTIIRERIDVEYDKVIKDIYFHKEKTLEELLSIPFINPSPGTVPLYEESAKNCKSLMDEISGIISQLKRNLKSASYLESSKLSEDAYLNSISERMKNTLKSVSEEEKCPLSIKKLRISYNPSLLNLKRIMSTCHPSLRITDKAVDRILFMLPKER